jgi:transcriptional regulator with XRE-family HTH domain
VHNRAALLPPTDERLRQFDTRLHLARRRRRLSAKQVAEHAGMSPMTLRSPERGGSGVTIGAYLAVMQVPGIENDLDLLAEAVCAYQPYCRTTAPLDRKRAARATAQSV